MIPAHPVSSSCTFWLRFTDTGPQQGSVDADDLSQALAAADDGGKMKSTYRIVKVHGHVSAAEQPTLI